MAKKMEAPETTADDLQKSILHIMGEMRDRYRVYPEYKTIMMNLTTISRELNAIRLKEVSGEIPQEAEE